MPTAASTVMVRWKCYVRKSVKLENHFGLWNLMTFNEMKIILSRFNMHHTLFRFYSTKIVRIALSMSVFYFSPFMHVLILFSEEQDTNQYLYFSSFTLAQSQCFTEFTPFYQPPARYIPPLLCMYENNFHVCQ